MNVHAISMSETRVTVIMLTLLNIPVPSNPTFSFHFIFSTIPSYATTMSKLSTRNNKRSRDDHPTIANNNNENNNDTIDIGTGCTTARNEGFLAHL
jgi:hypothetical protein